MLLASALLMAFGLPRPVVLGIAKILTPAPDSSLISTGLQPGDSAAISYASRFSGFPSL